MAITYPLSLPSVNPQAVRIELIAVSSVGISTSPFTFTSQRQEYSGMHWDAQVTLPPMARADAEEWIAFLLKLNGPTGTFSMGDPLGASPRGTVPGTPLVDGGSQTGQSLATDGWTADQTGVLLAGDYIQLGTYLYKVLNDVDSDGSGDATIDIWPRIRGNLANDTPLVTSGAKGLFRLAGTENPIASLGGHTDAPNYTIAFSATEAI